MDIMFCKLFGKAIGESVYIYKIYCVHSAEIQFKTKLPLLVVTSRSHFYSCARFIFFHRGSQSNHFKVQMVYPFTALKK